MRAAVEWMERWQVPLYLAALVVGAAVGLLAPAVAHPAELAINPVLGLLLYATFLGVPFAKIGQAFGRDHTTVMYAQRKILSEMAERREVFDHVKELTTRIRQRSKR